MEKPPSVVSVESEANKEKEKRFRAWDAIRGITLGSMIGASVVGGEVVRELMQPQISKSEVTNNLKDLNNDSEETVKEFVSLTVGDSVYRAEIDSGIKMRDFELSAVQLNEEGLINYADKMITEVDNKDGSKLAVKFEIVPGEMGGMRITYQQIDAHGRVLSQRISRLTPENPNILEEK